MTERRRRSWRTPIEVGLLAVLAYVPMLLSARGSVAADTKLYLYLDPGKLLADAPWTWDTRQFGGWVPHQVVGYLWPAGPYYWLMDAIGVPDWFAQRFWMATLLFLAGTGVRWAARKLGFGSGTTAFVPIVAALVYMLSPYVLPYISRTSVLLAPWAGLGWLIGLTVLAVRFGGWRHAALFALIIASIGGSNGTALVMIAPAPILYLLDGGIRGQLPWRRVLTTAAKIGCLTILVSVWWAAGVYVQGRYGADVLAFSETVQSTSYTSSSPEVLRGLGYWLFYVRDVAATTTAASGDYQTSTALIGWGWALIVAGFAGIAFLRWRARSFAALCVLAGVVLAVGVHPIDGASPLMRVFADHPRSSLVLALRSSSRAVPVSLFGLALGAAVGASWIAARWRRWGLIGPVAVVLLALLNVPALRSRAYVDAGLLHSEDVPAAWQQAAAVLDAAPGDARVLLLPGVESAAYRWGYTVDPVLPGISERDLIARDWLPLGSAPVMDLLYALDDRFQNGTIEGASIAPVARLLGSNTILVANDTAFERFRTTRPEEAWNLYNTAVPGLGAPTGFGDPVPNEPIVAMLDDAALTEPGIGEAMPPVALVPVEDASSSVARAGSGALVLLAGSGDGVVDAAAAGLVDGSGLLAYTASLDDELLLEQLTAGAALIVTDSNRDRAHHWRTSQDVTGFTEGPGTALLGDDPYDQRLPVFPDDHPDEQTLAVQRGPVVATATSYGEPNAYRPEDRPFMAIDGDPSTAWVTADRARATGEAIQLSADQPVSSLTLSQPDDPFALRWVTRVRITTDAGSSMDVELDPALRATGQQVGLPEPATTIRVEITATNLPDSGFYPGQNAVGFSEVDLGLGPTDEVVTLPARALAAASGATPVDVVMTRERVDPADRWRDDPERQLVRSFTLRAAVDQSVEITARLSPRATDGTLVALAGATSAATADRRVSGQPVATGWQAFDGDPGTAWITPFATPAPSTLTIPLGAARTVEHLELSTRTGEDYAQPTRLEIGAGGVTRIVDVPAGGGSIAVDFDALTGDSLTVTVAGTDGAATIDRRTWERVDLPVAISEVTIEDLAPVPPPTAIDTGCRDDLLTIDGAPVSVRVTGAWSDLVAGDPATVEVCGPATVSLAAGEHVVRTVPGLETGIDIDRVVLASAAPAPAQEAIAIATSRGRATRTIRVAACRDGCWLVQGEGWNPGWRATLNGDSLGRPIALSGGMNAWYLHPSNVERTVQLRWTPQTLIWIALAISAVSVLVCLVLAIKPLRRWRRKALAPLADEPDDADLDIETARAPVPAGWITVGAVFVAVTLVVDPVWGVLTAAVAGVAAFLGRRWITAAVAVLLATAVGVYVVAHEQRGGFGPGFGWVGEFARAHDPALAAVVLLAVTVVAGEWADQRRGLSMDAGAVSEGEGEAEP